MLFLGVRGVGGKNGKKGVWGGRGEYCTPPKFICEMAKKKRKKKDNMIR